MWRPPTRWRRSPRGGEVTLQISLDPEGKPSAVEVSEPAGYGFDEAAVEAAWRFRFKPLKIDDQPTAVQIEYLYTFTPPPPPPEEVKVPTGDITGELLRKGTRAPLVGVMVQAVDTNGMPIQEAITDEEGHFEIGGVPVGDFTLSVDEDGLEPVTDALTLAEGQALEVRYYLGPVGLDEDTVTIVGKRPKREVVVHRITAEEAMTAAGTQGDILKVVTNLPGAARTAFGSGDLILRGGYTQAVIERQDIPMAFHFGDLRSTISADLVETLDIYPGNYSAQYGRVNGGYVDIQLRQPSTEALHGFTVISGPEGGRRIETIKRVTVRERVESSEDEPNRNPEIAAFNVARLGGEVKRSVEMVEGSAQPYLEQRFTADGEVGELEAVTEELVYTWYTTAGETDPPLTFGDTRETTLRLPAGAGPTQVFVNVRDGRGGLAVAGAIVAP